MSEDSKMHKRPHRCLYKLEVCSLEVETVEMEVSKHVNYSAQTPTPTKREKNDCVW